MKLDTETLRQLIREAIREQNGALQQRDDASIYKDLTDEISKIQNDSVKMLRILDLLRTSENLEEGCGMLPPEAMPHAYAPMMGGGISDDDHEVEMAISDLHKLEEYAPKISQLAQDYSNLPGWVQAKITLAADYLGKVYHYLDGKHKQGM